MARKEGEKSEQYSTLFDTQGNFTTRTNPDGSIVDTLTEAIALYDELKKAADAYYDKKSAAAAAFNDLVADEENKAKKRFEREVEHDKTRLKIEQEIGRLRAEGTKEAQAQADKWAEILDKATKVKDAQKGKVDDLKKKTDSVKQKTDLLDYKYGDTLDAAKELEAAKKAQKEQRDSLIKQGLATRDFGMLKDGLTGGEGGAKGVINAIDKMTSALGGLVKQLDSTIQEIASYKSDWDTRLFGSGSTHTSLTDAIQHTLGASPYVKQTEVLKNIDKAVDAGIAYNVEQRAFLASIKDDIAGTFDAFDSTLLQIIRIQQSDSTAARLGMEAKLNEYLNGMYKNTEYLNNVSDSVTGALYEATALMDAKQSVGFEFQVQKWLGSLYSVGMSNKGVTDIASALGQLASGDVSGTTSGAGKLLVMAASRAGMDYSEMLTDGLDESEMNSLMKAMVEYLKTISTDNKVVQSQLANVYGLRTSDIESIRNLSTTDIKNITNETLSYSGALDKLSSMAASIGSRMSMGEMMTNVIDNFKATLSTGIANNPALYAMWTASNMLDQLVGGIPIPSIGAFAMGNGVDIDLETTVADLMRVGALGGSLLGGIGSMISGLANNANGLAGALNAMSALSTDQLRKKDSRGLGLQQLVNPKQRLTTTQFSSGQMSIIGNGSSGDVQESIISDADQQKQELANNAMQQTEEEDKDIKLMDVNDTLNKLIDIFEDLTTGTKKLSTKTEMDYTNATLNAGL